MFLSIKRGAPGLLGYNRGIIMPIRGYEASILDVDIIIVNSGSYRVFCFRWRGYSDFFFLNRSPFNILDTIVDKSSSRNSSFTYISFFKYQFYCCFTNPFHFSSLLLFFFPIGFLIVLIFFLVS